MYTAKVQVEIGAQFDQDIKGVVETNISRQQFINTIVASVPVEEFEKAKENEVKIFYAALFSFSMYLAEVMKGRIKSNTEIEGAACLCILGKVDRVNRALIRAHERSVVDLAMRTLSDYQAMDNSSVERGSLAVPEIIRVQLLLAEQRASIFLRDRYALGYVFGMSGSACSFWIDDTKTIEEETQYIQDTLSSVTGDDSGKLFRLAIQHKGDPDLEAVRRKVSKIERYAEYSKQLGEVTKPERTMSEITVATNIILKCDNDTLEGIVERALREMQKRKSKDSLENAKSIANHLLAELAYDLA